MGAFGTIEEHDGAVKGARNAKAKSKSAQDEAVHWCHDNLEVTKAESATFRDLQGNCSPQWHAICNVKDGMTRVVPAHEEALQIAHGLSADEMKKCSN